jgi:multiple sugar transport system permease protein
VHEVIMAVIERTAAVSAWQRWVRSRTLRQREMLAAFLFLLPNILGFLVFSVGPVIASAGISLLDWNLLNPPQWVGIGNYARLLTDQEFWSSLRVTLFYTLGMLPLSIIPALILAVALNQPIRGRTIYRTIFFLPVVSSLIAVSLLWRWLYNPSFGLLNYLLNGLFGMLGLPITAPDWLQSPTWAMPAIILMSAWKSLGYNMVLYLAGLQGIPRSLYEAAEIDGAGRWQRFGQITVPLLTPTTFFVIIITLIGSFQVFDQAYIMTGGGPARSTVTTVYYIYANGFERYQMGYASAIAWVLFLIILTLTMIQWRYQNRWVFYE